jgi:hypothetical protein
MSANPSDIRLTAKDHALKLLQEQDQGRPVWVRAPLDGHERYTGLTRAKLYELAGKGHIRSVSLRDPGRVRGCRLFHLQSLLDYIARAEAESADVGR